MRYFQESQNNLIDFQNELMHYGVKGQKWGIRHYQPYPEGKDGKFLGKKQAKRFIKTANQNARTMTKAKHMLDKTNKRIDKYSYKGKNIKLAIEKKDKKFHEKTIAEAKEAINEAIKYLDNAGYTVSSKTKNKISVNRGHQIPGAKDIDNVVSSIGKDFVYLGKQLKEQAAREVHNIKKQHDLKNKKVN